MKSQITEQRHQVARERKKSVHRSRARQNHFTSNRFHFFQNHFKSKLQQAVNNNYDEVQAAGAISCIVNDVNKRRTCSHFKICQNIVNKTPLLPIKF